MFDSGELGTGGVAGVGQRDLVDADRRCRRARTPTGAGFTRSCGARSASSPTDHVRRAFKFLFGALVIVVLGVAGFVAWYVFADNAPGEAEARAPRRATTGGPSTPDGPWHVAPGPSAFVGYRIKELFGDAVLKRDAVGRTTAVNGTLTIAERPRHDGGRDRRHLEARQRARGPRLLRPRQRARDLEVPDRALHADDADRAPGPSRQRPDACTPRHGHAACCTA